jgi:hypothetical protein
VSDLFRTLVLCGLLSGTQPVTLMGVLLVMSGPRPRANGFAFVLACFLVETLIVLLAGLLLGDRARPHTEPGNALIGVRIFLGVLLVATGLWLRRPPRREQPEVPKSLRSLHNLSPTKSFVAGLVLTDYQGPLIASVALVGATVKPGARLLALLPYTLFATGIPAALVIITTRSERARRRLTDSTDWVLRNRRPLGSWLALGFGLFLVGDTILSWLTTS